MLARMTLAKKLARLEAAPGSNTSLAIVNGYIKTYVIK